jgi:hypothetical protein
MIRTRLAGTRFLLVGLAAAAVVTASAAASVPVLTVSVHARLVPVTGAKAAGRFSGLLVKHGQPMGAEPSPTPRIGNKWRLSWKVSLPTLSGQTTVSLQVPARNGEPRFVHVLCTGCTSATKGTLALTNSQAIRVAQSHASVVVRTPSAMLRGTIKAQAIAPKPQGG